MIVILNWNGKIDTLACLASLKTNFETIVVDNGSTDDSVAAISQQFPEITVLQTGENLGYAGGNNVGIQKALDNGADFVLLLNNDTIVQPDFIASLLKSAKADAITGAYPLRFSDPQKLDHLGGIWNREKGGFDLIGLGERAGYKTDVQLDYVCGCSILIPRGVFETIGLLEPKYFLYWEEADFCMRAKKAGFHIEICYEASLLHKISASFIGGSPQKTYHWWRGRSLWIERNCSKEDQKYLFKKILLPELRHLRKLFLIKSAEYYLLKLLRKKNLSQKKNKLLQYKAALSGYRDYIEIKGGEC